MKKILFMALLFVACNHDTGRQPWPDGKIPFIMVGFTAEEEFEIVQAMITWELASGGKVEFFFYGTKKTDVKPLIIKRFCNNQFTYGAGYDADGMNYMQLIFTEQWATLHELGHVLGLEHEMSRPDRDVYIKINYETMRNFDPLMSVQFSYRVPELYDYKRYPFDYNSIMMYSDKDWGEVMDGRGHTLGGTKLTLIDALKIRDIYSGH